MCFATVKKYKRKPKALTYIESIKQAKRTSKVFNRLLKETKLGESLGMLNDAANPSGMFEPIDDEYIKNKRFVK